MSGRSREYLLSVGSNIEPERWVPRALQLLRSRFDVVAVSALYRAPAVGGDAPQPDFVNLAVRLRTDLPPRALREACRRIEEVCERRRTADRFAARSLDLDAVYEAPHVPADPSLPDPELLNEAYVLIPCAEIWPQAPHPHAAGTLATLAAERFSGWAEAHRIGDAP